MPSESAIDEFLLAACGAGYQRPRVAAAEKLLADHPEITRDSPHGAAAAGDVESLAAHTIPHLAAGPMNALPIVYACYSGLIKGGRRPGILAAVKMMLAHGADPNATYTGREFPDSPLSCLYGACGWLNDPELAGMLLDAGAHPNDGESLYHSTEHRDHECTRLLLARGASFRGANALNHMLDYEDIEGLRILFEGGADVNEPGVNHNALHHAILRVRGLEILRELLDRGARLEARDKQQRTPLMLARRLGLNEIATLLRERGAPEDGPTPKDEFLYACAAADADRAHGLRQDASALDPADQRVLPDGAQLGHYDAVKLMLELGFPVAAKGDWDSSAIHQAAFRGDTRMVTLLLDHGARWDEKNGYGGDAFGSAIWPYRNDPHPCADYLGVVRLLLESGGQVPDAGLDADDPMARLLDEWRNR